MDHFFAFQFYVSNFVKFLIFGHRERSKYKAFQVIVKQFFQHNLRKKQSIESILRTNVDRRIFWVRSAIGTDAVDLIELYAKKGRFSSDTGGLQ